MIKHTNEGREYLFVEALSETAMSILATCDYSMVGMASEATESQAADIVEFTDADFADDNEPPDLKRFYRDYNDAFACYTALESLQSLLTSHGLKMDGTLILQKL